MTEDRNVLNNYELAILSPKLFLSEYFDQIENKIDSCTEVLKYKHANNEEVNIQLDETRDNMFKEIEVFRNKCYNNIPKDCIQETIKKFENYNQTYKFNEFKRLVFSNQTFQFIEKQINYQDKFENNVSIGYLILIDHFFTESQIECILK